VLDTDQDGLKDAEEANGWDVVVRDALGDETTTRVTSDPLKPDTDRDGLPDLPESMLRTNPTARDTAAADWSELLRSSPATGVDNVGLQQIGRLPRPLGQTKQGTGEGDPLRLELSALLPDRAQRGSPPCGSTPRRSQDHRTPRGSERMQ